jgi:hypothetical protein
MGAQDEDGSGKLYDRRLWTIFIWLRIEIQAVVDTTTYTINII